MSAERMIVRTWFEPIDAAHVAIVSFCEFTTYGQYYAASFFLIADRAPDDWAGRWRDEERGRQHFQNQLDRHHDGRLPFICFARDRRD